MSRLMRSIRSTWEHDPRKNPNEMVYILLGIGALAFPIGVQIATRGGGSFLISQAADAGVYVLLAIGLNVVVGFAGLLDLGYAAFFAIGAYTYAFIASDHMEFTPIHQAIHIPFWIALLVGMFAARRLPRDRDARFRRDRPPALPKPQRVDERRQWDLRARYARPSHLAQRAVVR
ncbi:MAG: hypothetical protein E6J13_01800 [Chloroflexi bacterium]|nr:MAG: hypothetical protein E6J13_01800 [Chloroflexota bacterium]